MKKLASIVSATTFVLGLALTTYAATSIECKILAAKEDTVIMDCGKQSKGMTVGSKVKLHQENVKTKKKAELVEGC